MADKLRIEDLKGVFRNNENIQLEADGAGPETGAPEYNKYGIYSDSTGRTEFLWVVMERDDPAANPDGPLTEDDYIPRSVARFDLQTQSWKTEAGNMNLVSSQSFSFIDDDLDFFTRLNAYAKSMNVSLTPDESAP